MELFYNFRTTGERPIRKFALYLKENLSKLVDQEAYILTTFTCLCKSLKFDGKDIEIATGSYHVKNHSLAI